MLTLKIRAPTNARSFSVRTQFFSAEYPEWVCSEFNDFFVALTDSAADNPADGNIAIYGRWRHGVAGRREPCDGRRRLVHAV